MSLTADKLEATYQQGLDFLSEGSLAEAEQTLQNVLNILPDNPNVLERLGYCYALQKKWQHAEALFQQALLMSPNNAQILNNFACILQKQQKWLEAVNHFTESLSLNPNNLTALCNLALCLQHSGQHERALEKYEQVIIAEPDNISIRFSLAELLFNLKHYQAAIAHYEHIISLSANHPKACILQALCYFACGFEDKSAQLINEIAYLERAVTPSLIQWSVQAKNEKNFSRAAIGYGLLTQLVPEDASYHKAYILNSYLAGMPIDQLEALTLKMIEKFPNDHIFPKTLSVAYGQAGKTTKALEMAQQFINTAPHDPMAHTAYASLHLQKQRLDNQEISDFDTPIASYMMALKLTKGNNQTILRVAQGIIETKDPKVVQACYNAFHETFEKEALPPIVEHLLSGYLASKQKNFETAKDHLLEACKLAPKSGFAHNELADAFYRIHDIESAIATSRHSITLQEHDSQAYMRHGTLLTNCGLIDEGLAASEKALAMNPQDSDLHFSLGMNYLLRGEWKKGWKLYDARFKFRHRNPIQIPPVPRWDGSHIDNLELIICCEQGLGDIIQFARFVTQVAPLATKTFFVTRASLVHLFEEFSQQNNSIFVIPENVDFAVSRSRSKWCPLMDLPNLLNLAETEWAKTVPYIKTDEQTVKLWQDKIGTHGLKVGIVWQGNPDHDVDIGRSIPLKYYEPLCLGSATRLISLQKKHGLEQLDQITFADQIELLDEGFDEGDNAFEDTIHIMQALDLIITSDTSTAHLAGALGVPVWLGLKFSSEWRWQLKREDSPWYPTMRIFRQQKLGDWASVMDKMALDLQQLFEGDQSVLIPKKLTDES